jgi:hypothetical protein
VTVVILSAFVPTLIAQHFSRPSTDITVDEEETLAEEDMSILHPRHTRPENLDAGTARVTPESAAPRSFTTTLSIRDLGAY